MSTSRCQSDLALERLCELLNQPAVLAEAEQAELLTLAQRCYESWCLRPGLVHSVEIRVSGLVLLARASLRAQQPRQALIHARRAWRLLRPHAARQRIVPVLLELLVHSAEGCDAQAAEHWRHIATACGVRLDTGALAAA